MRTAAWLTLTLAAALVALTVAVPSPLGATAPPNVPAAGAVTPPYPAGLAAAPSIHGANLSWADYTVAAVIAVSVGVSDLGCSFATPTRDSANVTTYAISGLAQNTSYCATVALWTVAGQGTPAEVNFTTLPSLPTAPGAPAVIPGIDSADVSWAFNATSDPAITGVALSFQRLDEGNATVLGLPPVSSATIRGLLSGIAYRVAVAFQNPSGSSPESNWTTFATILPAPVAVSALAWTNSSVTLAWTVPDYPSNYTLYSVYRSLDGCGNPVLAAQVAFPAVSAHVTGLPPSTTYCWTVTISTANESSAPSAPLNVTTSASGTVPNSCFAFLCNVSLRWAVGTGIVAALVITMLFVARGRIERG